MEVRTVVQTRFALVRHAESVWNAAGRWQGHGDPPLSDRGVRQAEALAEALAEGGFDLFVSSDLQRARETAFVLAETVGREPVPAPQFRELDVGRWTGLTRREIAGRDGALLAAFEGGDPDVRPGGGESRREIRARVRSGVEELAAACPGGRILLVTHLGVIRALLPGVEAEHVDVRVATLAEIRSGAEAQASAAGAASPEPL